MKITIILVAVLAVVLAAYNLWLAIHNRSAEKLLNRYQDILDRKDRELNIREGAVEEALERIKNQKEAIDFTSAGVKQIRASYIVSGSDEYKYANEKLMENGIRKHLAATLADSLMREFGAPDEDKTQEGRRVLKYSFLAKRT